MIIKRNNIEKSLKNYFAVISGYQPVYSTYAGGIYEMELTRAAIHCFATHCSKLKPEVIGNAAPGLERILQFRPNPLMDTKKYLYRLATAYMTDNNAVIAPITEFDEVKGFYPMALGKMQLVEHMGVTYVRYDMEQGEHFAVEFSKCGIINQFQYTSELWGESNICLKPTLELIDAQNKGIINGIKNSAVIRFIAKLANTLRPKDIKDEQDRLKEINLDINNTAGVFIIDQKYEDVKQIDSKPYIINPSQMEYIKQNVFNYFGTNEHILQNKFTPDEWNAYYEGKIEPFALEIGLVHTNMTFTEREKAFGNQIFFSANRLQYASISDKINYVVQMGDRGRTSINEDREVFNLPPIENGDRHFIRGEYRPVDSYEEPVETAEPLISGNKPVDKSAVGGIIEERGWVTINGKHVFIGDDGGGSGGGSLTECEEAALTAYISSESYKVNEKLRVGQELTADEQKLVDNLDSALEKMPKFEGTVYRSMSSDMIDDEKQFWNIHSPDAVVTYPAFTSASTSIYDETMDIQMEINSKTARDIRKYNSNENEVLFQRNPLFHITAVKGKKIFMEEV